MSPTEGDEIVRGRMQSWPLTVNRFIDHAARWHGEREVISYCDDGVVCRQTYASLREDATRLSSALLAAGIRAGDRVATLAMNSGGHFVAWYAITGIGAICHTLNPRIGEDQLLWIIEDAQDRMLIVDGAFADIAERLASNAPGIEKIIYLTTPHASGRGELLDDYIAGFRALHEWPVLDENAAAGLCYTSGTTGRPKGVLYSHRSNVLHTLMAIQPDAINLSACDVIMPIVPMYHANAWGLIYAAPAVGAKLVLPGAQVDGRHLYEQIRSEGVTMAAAVPTVWSGLLDFLETNNAALPTLSRAFVGGAALSEHLFRRFEAQGIKAIASWGMTELSPIGTVSAALSIAETMRPEERMASQLKQGRVPFGIDMRLVDEAGKTVAHDGRSPGHLQVRGAAVTAVYFREYKEATNADGYFDTGDIATIDRHGYMKITDRTKDIIKSGGEWISSVELENAAISFPGVVMAAAIGVPHPKWDERPFLILTVAPGSILDLESLRAHLTALLPKWWLPDEIRIVDQIPTGSTGKIDKMQLRRLVGSYASV